MKDPELVTIVNDSLSKRGMSGFYIFCGQRKLGNSPTK